MPAHIDPCLSLLDPPKAQLDAAKEEQQQDQQQDQIVVQDIEDEGEDEDAVLGEPIANEDDGAPVELTCCVMLQKEGPGGLYDERCGKATPDKMAGLCELVTDVLSHIHVYVSWFKNLEIFDTRIYVYMYKYTCKIHEVLNYLCVL